MSSDEPPHRPGRVTIALFGKSASKKTVVKAFFKNHKSNPKELNLNDFVLRENNAFRIISTPDFLDKKHQHPDQKIIDLMALSDPGPDLFMLALGSESTGQVEEAAAQINQLQHIFGEAIRKHIVIIAENEKSCNSLRHFKELVHDIELAVVNKNLPDQCADWLPDQSFQFDDTNYFLNAVKRRKEYFGSTRNGFSPDKRDTRGPSLINPPRSRRIPPEFAERATEHDLGRSAHSLSGTEFNIVLLGKTGTGKSASATTILAALSQRAAGQCFESKASSMPVTTKCEVKRAQICGTQVRVVDTPDFFYEEEHVEKVQLEECKKYCQTDTCVVLLVIQLGRFTDGERGILEKMEKHLGWKIREKTIVLLTHGDHLNGNVKKAVEQFMEEVHLRHIVEVCSHRYHVFNNLSKNYNQVKELVEKFPEMFPGLTVAQFSSQCCLI